MPAPNTKLWDRLSRKITILVVPHAHWKPLRMEFTAAFLCFCVALWSGITVWAGFIAGRHVDYWITKADNEVMVAKLSRLSREMNESWRVLSEAQATDEEMRSLLNMSRRNDDEGVGGPTAADRAALQRLLMEGPAQINQPAWHKEMADIRAESYKRLASFQEIAWYISNEKNRYNSIPNMWPTDGVITSLFGYRVNPIRNGDDEGFVDFHPGIDIANKPNTLIHATAAGTVRYAGWSHGYGQLVFIDHGYGISTLYGHNSKLLVQMGDHVWRGEAIAYMGMTGRATGAHCHYEIRINGRPVNPMRFLKVHATHYESLNADVPDSNGSDN